MTSPSKRSRKKGLEPIDWRELAEGPALRGLAEVLAIPTPTAVDATVAVPSSALPLPPYFNVSPAVDERPTVGEQPAVAEIPALVPGGSPTEEVAVLTDSKCLDEIPTVVDTPGQEDSPTVGGTAVRPVPQSKATSVSPTVGGGWVDTQGVRYPGRRVLRVASVQDSLALGEERVYRLLWHAQESEGVYPDREGAGKTFSMGYDRLAHLVRLNEKSVRMVLPKLIAKRALEVVAAENSATRTGRTYRIFSEEEILERQRAAGLIYVVKNGRAVEFVQTSGEPPSVGVSISDGETPAKPVTAAVAARAIVGLCRDILRNPNAKEEDRRFARELLHLG